MTENPHNPQLERPTGRTQRQTNPSEQQRLWLYNLPAQITFSCEETKVRLITAGAAANQVSTSERSSITGTNTTIVKKKKKKNYDTANCFYMWSNRRLRQVVSYWFNKICWKDIVFPPLVYYISLYFSPSTSSSQILDFVTQKNYIVHFILTPILIRELNTQLHNFFFSAPGCEIQYVFLPDTARYFDLSVVALVTESVLATN